MSIYAHFAVPIIIKTPSIWLRRVAPRGWTDRSTARRGAGSQPQAPAGAGQWYSARDGSPAAAVIESTDTLSLAFSPVSSAVLFLQLQAMKEARNTIAWWQQRQAKLSQKLSQRKNKLVSSALQKLPLKATQARR